MQPSAGQQHHLDRLTSEHRGDINLNTKGNLMDHYELKDQLSYILNAEIRDKEDLYLAMSWFGQLVEKSQDLASLQAEVDHLAQLIDNVVQRHIK